MKQLFILAGSLCMLTFVCRAATPPAATHDKAYWHAVMTNDFAVPTGESIGPLVRELSGYLASPDPELRDDIAYNVLVHWIYVQDSVPARLRDKLVAKWKANLKRGIGEVGTDSVFRRSYSALMLSVIAATDIERRPILDQAAFDDLLDAALAYLHDEKDTRGFDAAKGWIHSVAHTADVLKFLGRNRKLRPRDQARILNAIGAKLAAVDHALIYGEDERLARAVVSIVARPDADLAAFDAFLTTLKPAPIEGRPTPAQLAVRQNRKHVAMALYALLATDNRENKSLAAAREHVHRLLTSIL